MKPRQRPGSDKWNLWPWKYWMTIGVGVICSESKKKPDRIILASDSLGSFGDAYSMASHCKLIWHQETKLIRRTWDKLPCSQEKQWHSPRPLKVN